MMTPRWDMTFRRGGGVLHQSNVNPVPCSALVWRNQAHVHGDARCAEAGGNDDDQQR